jgi:polygalacturonase
MREAPAWYLRQPGLWVLLLTLLGGGHPSAASDLDISVADYGAIGDGQTLCTEAFHDAVGAIAAAGGGILRVPPGEYFSGPIDLTSNLVLWLARGATLKADTNRQRLNLIPAIPAYGPNPPSSDIDPRKKQADLRDAIPRVAALLHGVGLNNVTITGENGTLDGQGVAWWKLWLEEPLDGRPHLIQFEKSRNIRLFNVTLVNPGFWAVHLWLCEYVHVRYLSVLVIPWDPPVRPTNTDGVNPDSSQHVLIEDSYFQTGDDAVAIKSGWDCFGRAVNAPARNITVRRIRVGALRNLAL